MELLQSHPIINIGIVILVLGVIIWFVFVRPQNRTTNLPPRRPPSKPPQDFPDDEQPRSGP